MNKGVKLIAAVGAIALLGGCYYGLRSYNQQQTEKEELAAAGETILEVDTAALSGVKITMGDTTWSFEKTDGTWQCLDDTALPVSEEKLMEMLDVFKELKSYRNLNDAEDVSEYGLDAPGKVFYLTDDAGNETSIAVGDSNANTGYSYLMLNDQADVIYTVGSEVASSFASDLLSYAESEELPAFTVTNVTALQVEGNDISYSFVKKDGS